MSCLLAACAALFFLGRFAFDDLYISFRYAEHFAVGHGFRWNLDMAPVEGFTNLFLVLIITCFSLIGLDLLVAVQVFNILLAGLTGMLLSRLTERLLPFVPALAQRFLPLAIVLAYLINPYTWQNALSGLETTLFVFLLALSLHSLCKWYEGRGMRWVLIGSALAFLASVTRPDGVLFGLVAPTIFLLHRLSIKAILMWIVGFVLPLLAFELWRYSYFGAWVPNTFTVKVGAAVNVFAGRTYVKEFYQIQIAMLVVACYGFWIMRRHALVQAIALWTLGLSVFYIVPQPFQGFYYRFLYSILVLVLPVAVVGLTLVSWRFKETFRWMAIAILASIHLGLNWSAAKDEEIQAVIPEATAMYRELGETLHSLPGADTLSFAYQDAGVVPYYSRLKHYDLVGLNDWSIAHAANVQEIITYLEREAPDIILLPAERPREGDSCFSIFRQGHGRMGEVGPAMLGSGLLDQYDLTGRYAYIGYDILVYVRAGQLYTERVQLELRRKDYTHLVLLPAPNCLQ